MREQLPAHYHLHLKAYNQALQEFDRWVCGDLPEGTGA